MKKIVFLFASFLGITAISTAQELFQCGTAPGYTALDTSAVPWYGNGNLLYGYLDKYAEYLMDRTPVEMRAGQECSEIEAALAIPIKFWIWRENESDNPINELDIQVYLDVLNQAFVSNGLNFRFYTYCTEFPIDADLVDINDSDELPFTKKKIKKGNVFIRQTEMDLKYRFLLLGR